MDLLGLCDSERVWHGFLWGNISHIWWFSRCPYAEQLAGVSASTIPLMIQFTLVRHPLLKVCEWHCSPPVALLECTASSSEPRTTPVCVCVWERDSEKGGGGREMVWGGGGGKGHWSVSEWSVSLVSPSEGKHPAEDSVEMNSMRRWAFDPMSVLAPPSPLSWLTDTDYILSAMTHCPSVITSPEHFLNSTLVCLATNGQRIPRMKCHVMISVYFLSIRFHPYFLKEKNGSVTC